MRSFWVELSGPRPHIFVGWVAWGKGEDERLAVANTDGGWWE